MTQTVFELCEPRADIRDGSASDSEFAADLAQVVRGTAPLEYNDPARFFATTYPTEGLKSLLANVCGRITGKGGSVAAIFRLDTSFGGGKTHALIALVHTMRGLAGVAAAGEFIDPALVPTSAVRVAAFDGENADPSNGRRMAPTVLAYTPWGEIAYALAGEAGYERVRRSDEQGVAPGAETIGELFGDQPALVLIDELAVYLRKCKGKPGAAEQLTAFMTSLFKAIESSPNAALVYTLAMGKDGKSTDAYSYENQFVADQMMEVESVSARKATLLNPTKDDETVQVLLRRLFGRIDRAGAAQVVAEYQALWTHNRDSLCADAAKPATAEAFARSYPLHPDVLDTLTTKTATLQNFQRVRGMLRILGRTVARLWAIQPADATAIHVHHIDPGYDPIGQEITTRLGQSMYLPAIRADIAGPTGAEALAQEIDARNHKELPGYAVYVARTIFLHSLAFNDGLKGVAPEHLRYSVLSPATDISFIEEARKAFVAQSAYLDDRPTAPLRFNTEANLTQIIRREEQAVDANEVREQVNDRVKAVFKGADLELVAFPSGPWEVPDEIGNGRPLLVLLSPDACAVGATVETIPDLIVRMYERKGSDSTSYRLMRNNLVFLLAEDGRVGEMRARMKRRLALRALKGGPRLAELAEHQQIKVREFEARSEVEAVVAIQQAFRHLFYPSEPGLGGGTTKLAHSALDTPGTSEKPGAGQQQVVRALRDYRKLRLPEDDPDAPGYIRDRTPLNKGQITTAALREEFRRDPKLPMLVGDDVFIKGIRKGVASGDYVYRRGDLLYGKGDAFATINIDEQATVFTMAFALAQAIWPRPVPKPVAAALQANPGAQVFSTDSPAVHGNLGESTQPGIFGAAPAEAAATPTSTESQPLQAEGVLREALTRIWEQARGRRIGHLGTLTIRVFEAMDGFRLVGAMAAVRAADSKLVTIEGSYETAAGSTLEVLFTGTLQDAAPVKDFLDPQLRAAAEKTVQVRFDLAFTEGLSMAGDTAEKVAEQLTRYATGAAYVEATATASRPASAAKEAAQ